MCKTSQECKSHREPTQAVSLVVCLKYKDEMYGRIWKSLNIVNLYWGMSKLKLKIKLLNVNLPQLLCIVI